jgi:Xaa-Pro dipeptidase
MYEYQLEGFFKGYCIANGGCRYTGYTCISCTGKNGSVLHYGHAGAPLDGQIRPNDMLLLDMGAEYQGYCADITCSFPAGGKFNDDHREVYEAVYEAQQAVFVALHPGVLWTDMHRLAERVILEHLVKYDFVRSLGKSLEELHRLHIPAIFMPHGLGHLLGLDVHDVGGYPTGVERPKEPGIKRLRTGRVLQEGMVLTVEPGVYFIEANIQNALGNPEQCEHLNMNKLRRFLDSFGGVRLEDDIVITKNGYENLTVCPRKIADIERIMKEARDLQQ